MSLLGTVITTSGNGTFLLSQRQTGEKKSPGLSLQTFESLASRALLCAYPKTKRCELFTTTDLCKLPSCCLQTVGNGAATAWSSWPPRDSYKPPGPPPQPATLSALPNSLPTDHPIQSCPPLLPAKLDNGPWPPSALTFILLQLEGKLPVEITQTSRSNQKICIPAPFPSPKPLA